MSAKTTRQAFADYLHRQCDGVMIEGTGNPLCPSIFTAPQGVVTRFPKPYAVVSALDQRVDMYYTGIQSNRPSSLNWYSIAFIVRPVSETGQTQEEAQDTIDQFVELVVSGFAVQSNRGLKGAVKQAATQIHITYDRHGDYLNYYGVPTLGCFIDIDVMEKERMLSYGS